MSWVIWSSTLARGGFVALPRSSVNSQRRLPAGASFREMFPQKADIAGVVLNQQNPHGTVICHSSTVMRQSAPSRGQAAAGANAWAGLPTRPADGSGSRSPSRLTLDVFPILRQHHDAEPEVLDRFHHCDKLLQIHRLGNVAVGVKAVRLQHVLFIL